MKAATERTYKIAKSDEAALGLETEPTWYTPEGAVDHTQGNIARLQDNSINLALVVELVKADPGTYTLTVLPIVLRLHAGGSSIPERLELTDPSMPGWVKGKVDSLALEIYQALKQYAVATHGTMPAASPASPASPAAAPAPASPTATSPAP